jgi:hypothetical protein
MCATIDAPTIYIYMIVYIIVSVCIYMSVYIIVSVGPGPCIYLGCVFQDAATGGGGPGTWILQGDGGSLCHASVRHPPVRHGPGPRRARCLGYSEYYTLSPGYSEYYSMSPWIP